MRSTGSRFVLRLPQLASVLGASVLMLSTASHALFDDAEARKQILQLRTQVNDSQRVIDNRLNELEAQAKNRSLIDLFTQVEALKGDFAQLRGQIEVLQHTLDTAQKRQRDLYVDLDDRLRKLEDDAKAAAVAAAAKAAATVESPATTSANGGVLAAPAAATSGSLAPAATASAPATSVASPQPQTDPAFEQRNYDLALEHFRAGRFAEAITAFQLFTRNYPNSGLVPSAQYWIGNSLYATRDYRGAIATQRQLIAQHPGNTKASDALLNIASAQAELNDFQAARATLQEVINKYPNSEAAAKARQRLGNR